MGPLKIGTNQSSIRSVSRTTTFWAAVLQARMSKVTRLEYDREPTMYYKASPQEPSILHLILFAISSLRHGEFYFERILEHVSSMIVVLSISTWSALS
jgi:hypothetical protein